MTNSTKIPLKFQIYTSQYHDECRELLCDAFTRRTEPLGSHISYESGAFQFFSDHKLEEADRSGMSTVCIDANTEKAVGIILTEDLFVEEDEASRSFMNALESKWGDWFPRVFQAIEQVEKPFLEHVTATGERKAGRGWHMLMVGVSADYAKMGIGSRLVNENLKLAQKKGFSFAVADCTSIYSSKCFAKHGFTLHNRFKYADYEFPPGSNTFPLREKFGNKDGFDGMDFMVRSLRSKPPCLSDDSRQIVG